MYRNFKDDTNNVGAYPATRLNEEVGQAPFGRVPIRAGLRNPLIVGKSTQAKSLRLPKMLLPKAD